ncbi:MAG: restriction endonuclease subunit S [Lachnospiraceae bacterium]|nr:restriction endonuclease subunit S [Lachnospiraceae bacterium]
MKYNLFTLGELARIKYGKNQKKVQSEDGTIPIYGTGGLMGYATEALYDKPSVLIGRKGTINKVRYVDHPFWTVDTLFYTEVNNDIVIPMYLYYLMSLFDLDTYNEGTTIPSLRTETLNRIEFAIPDLDYQSKVVSILEPIDRKIQLNTEINDNLPPCGIELQSGETISSISQISQHDCPLL